MLLRNSDDILSIGIGAPGIHLYLGIHAGILEKRRGVRGSAARDRRYKQRMPQHTRHVTTKVAHARVRRAASFAVLAEEHPLVPRADG